MTRRLPDARTDEEKQQDMQIKRAKMQEAATLLSNDLLDAGYRTWINNHQQGPDYFWCHVIIDADDIDVTRFADAMLIAQAHGAKPHMEEIHMHGDRFARLAFWPVPMDDQLENIDGEDPA